VQKQKGKNAHSRYLKRGDIFVNCLEGNAGVVFMINGAFLIKGRGERY